MLPNLPSNPVVSRAGGVMTSWPSLPMWSSECWASGCHRVDRVKMATERLASSVDAFDHRECLPVEYFAMSVAETRSNMKTR